MTALLPSTQKGVDIRNGFYTVLAYKAMVLWEGVYIHRLFAIQSIDETTGIAVVKGMRLFTCTKWRFFKEPIIMIFPGVKITFHD